MGGALGRDEEKSSRAVAIRRRTYRAGHARLRRRRQVGLSVEGRFACLRGVGERHVPLPVGSHLRIRLRVREVRALQPRPRTVPGTNSCWSPSIPPRNPRYASSRICTSVRVTVRGARGLGALASSAGVLARPERRPSHPRGDDHGHEQDAEERGRAHRAPPAYRRGLALRGCGSSPPTVCDPGLQPRPEGTRPPHHVRLCGHQRKVRGRVGKVQLVPSLLLHLGDEGALRLLGGLLGRRHQVELDALHGRVRGGGPGGRFRRWRVSRLARLLRCGLRRGPGKRTGFRVDHQRILEQGYDRMLIGGHPHAHQRVEDLVLRSHDAGPHELREDLHRSRLEQPALAGPDPEARLHPHQLRLSPQLMRRPGRDPSLRGHRPGEGRADRRSQGAEDAESSRSPRINGRRHALRDARKTGDGNHLSPRPTRRPNARRSTGSGCRRRAARGASPPARRGRC